MRYAASIFCAISLLIAVAILGLWARSYHHGDWISRNSEERARALLIGSDRGILLVVRQCLRRNDFSRSEWSFKTGPSEGSDEYGKDDERIGLGGFCCVTSRHSGFRERTFLVPHWAVAVALLILPISWFRMTALRRRAERRRRSGRCFNCGYDLRASTDRCPECAHGLSQLPPPSTAFTSIVVTVTLLLLCAAGAAIWWSNPARGAARGLGADPDRGIDFYPVWESPPGDRPDRMRRLDWEWGQEWYQSIWHAPDGDGLVVIYRGVIMQHMFYDYWTVAVLDRSLHVVRTGLVGIPSDAAPFRLMEMRSNDPSAPASARGKWFLAVKWNFTNQTAPATHDDQSDEKPSDSMNTIDWDDTERKPDSLRDSANLEVRSAEQ